jgi:hypothetical protein
MRIHIVYDKTGAIVGGGVGFSELATSDLRIPRSGPMAREGHQAGEFDVPAELHGSTLRDIVDRLHVDIRGKEHRLVTKGK